MESVHGVDVSWLHQPNREHHHRSHAPSSPGLPRDVRPPTSSHGGLPSSPPTDTTSAPPADHDSASDSPAAAPPTTASAPAAVATSAPKPSTNNDSPASKPPSNRPGLLSRNGTDKQPGASPRGSRRNSWMTSISSKFSSSSVPTTAPATQTSKANANGTNAGPSQQKAKDQLPSPQAAHRGPREAEELQPYVPQKPKDANSSFFSSLTRRLSSNAQGGASGKMADNGGMCPRKVMNVDLNRERCLVPELDLAKLRRVSFSVDVEIAAGPKYKEDESGSTKQKKAKDRKIKDRAEGEALKHPEAVIETKERSDDAAVSTDDAVAASEVTSPLLDGSTEPEANDTGDDKPEKKQRTEEEKRERKERKRRKAEESGQLPVELTQEDAANGAFASQTTTPPQSGTATPRSQDRPTTDPVRIYRRCCQLRETPILKRITEQLMAPNCTMPDDPGVVTELNLTGSRLQVADVVTLSDWLAIVPVKRLLLEDADLNDEGVRLVLAGLLAAKKPEPIKRRNNGTRQPSVPSGGMVEKVTLKNNPRISKAGWKHIALFLYMCRSIKAFDVSMLQFPQIIPPPPTEETPVKPPSKVPSTAGHPVDAAELLSKALAERLGGATLQELTMAECGLNAAQIRKIVDGATMCRTGRLGLAGNHLDDEGFEYVLGYVRSGVCQALDLGSNDMRGKLGRLAEALSHNKDSPFWGISLAGCNLDTACLKDLLPALVHLRDFRFIDLSHNRNLFGSDACSLQLLRRYIPKLIYLKRLHLRDVGLAAKHAISLAEVLPENPSLAHLTILENPQLSALATNTDEQSQEEACALYASLTAAVRVSPSIVCIDIDVPSSEHGEVVKALAKQVVAYCLRNMDRSMTDNATSITATLSKPHGVDDARDVPLPNVLSHLVGYGDQDGGLHDDEDAPDDDYIVGGNGIVKALQYFLGEEAVDIRRGSFPVSGATTPKERHEEAVKRRGKAKEVSKYLLDAARKMRTRLEPALVKEFASGDELAYRRLLFLDETLKGMIFRFENEYPETRVSPPSPQQPASLSSSLDSRGSPHTFYPADGMASSVGTLATEVSGLSLDSDLEDDDPVRSPLIRRTSDVSLASRALSLEEGRIHRLGSKVRQELVTHHTNVVGPCEAENAHDSGEWAEGSHMAEMAKRMGDMSGPELKSIVDHVGWDGVMQKLGANLEELRQLQMKDPVGWEQFKESQLKARANVGRAEESAIE
ncbi:hypothetical protein MBLNU459_g0387t1 [Dothideomycetes sp. NU459]